MQRQTPNQPQDESLATPSYQCLAPLVVTSAIIVSSKVGYHCYRSKNIGPEVVCAGDSVYFGIPLDTRRKIFYGFGPETEVARIEIELLCRETKERQIIQLSKEFPYEVCPIIPNSSYVIKWRTHEDGHFWSAWSKLKSLVSKFPYFTLSPGGPSRAKNQECINKIGLGPKFNALLLGKPGSGKSSLLNSFFSAIAGEYKHAATTSPEGLTNTQCKTGYELIPGTAYISDFPGWEEAFSLALLKRVLLDNLDITVDQLKRDCHDLPQPTPSDAFPRINVAILVMSAVNLMDEKVLLFHKQIIELLKKSKIPVIGVVTKMDLIVSDEEKPVSRERFFQDSRVIAKNQQALLDAKFPLINYDLDEATNDGVDELLLHIIKTCQEKSQSDGSNRS